MRELGLELCFKIIKRAVITQALACMLLNQSNHLVLSETIPGFI